MACLKQPLCPSSWRTSQKKAASSAFFRLSAEADRRELAAETAGDLATGVLPGAPPLAVFSPQSWQNLALVLLANPQLAQTCTPLASAGWSPGGIIMTAAAPGMAGTGLSAGLRAGAGSALGAALAASEPF